MSRAGVGRGDHAGVDRSSPSPSPPRSPTRSPRCCARQAPEELDEMIQGATRMMRNVGGTLFAMQLGQVVGQLSSEVVSGGDIGIPLLDGEQAAARAAEHGRLRAGPRHPRSTRCSSTSRCANSRTPGSSGTRSGCGCTCSRRSPSSPAASASTPTGSRSSPTSFDPTNPEELREALTNGALIPPKTDEQLAALARLETDARPHRGLGRRRDRGSDHAAAHERRDRRDRAPPAGLRAVPPSRRSRPSSASSCARAGCARPPRCGRR